MAETFSYEKSIQEIENIILEIENNNVGIDEITKKVSKATLLLKKCKEKLSNTQKDIDDLFNDED